MSSPSSGGTSSIVTPVTGAATRQAIGPVEFVEDADAAVTAADVGPERFASDAERRNDTNAGDDDAWNHRRGYSIGS